MTEEREQLVRLQRELAQAQARIAELEGSHDQVHRILESITDCYFHLDSQGDIGTVNDRAAAYLKQSPDLMIGRNLWDLLPGGVRTRYGQIFCQVQATRVPVHEEVPSWVNPGRWVELHVYPSDEGLDVYFRDITDRKQTEQALQESEAKLRAFYNSASTCMGVVELPEDDQDVLHLYDNPATCRFFGLEPGATANRWVSEMGGTPQTVELWIRHYRQSQREGQPVQFDYTYPTPQSPRWLSVNVTCLGPGDSGRTRFCYVAEEITERKRMERQLQELNETLEQRVAHRTAEAEQRLTQLQKLTLELTQAEQRERQRLAQMLHDHLQQLMVAAKHRAGVLRAGVKDSRLHDAAQQLLQLLDESIGVSRSLTVDLVPPVLYEEDFSGAMRWLAGWMEDKHGLHVQVQADASIELPKGTIRLLLFQAVRELLLNVVKHAGTDQASVIMTREVDQMRIIVADSGRGFDLAKLFPGAATTGLGLAGLRERLELLGGSLAIDTDPGHGSRVMLRITINSLS